MVRRVGRGTQHATFKEPAFELHALAIGRLALAWNDLHERLAEMFWALLGGAHPDRPMSVWNSANFDRARREMLKAAALTYGPRGKDDSTKFADDIKWLLDRTDEFENIRNDAVHSPLLLHAVSLGTLNTAPVGTTAAGDIRRME